MDAPLEFFTSKQPVGRNRRWPAAKKALIVAETLEPGARVPAVAARHGLKPNHVSSWRTMARRGELILPAPETPAEFAALIVSPECVIVGDGAAGMLASKLPGVPRCTSRPEITIGAVTIRLDEDTPAVRIADIVHALNAAP